MLTNKTQIETLAKKLSARIAKLQKDQQYPDNAVIRVKKHGNHNYLYLRASRKDDRKEHYIPVSDSKKYRALARKCYAKHMLPVLERDLAVLEKLLSQYSWKNELLLADHFAPELIGLCGAGFESRQTYIRKWQAQTWTERPARGGPPSFPTKSGCMVRSKSEAFIADALFDHGLMFAYEKPLYLKGRKRPYFPDFTILHPVTLKELYWEHFGLMDDPEYSGWSSFKLMEYMRCGLYPGHGLICTFETLANPLYPTDVEQIIRHFFGC